MFTSMITEGREAGGAGGAQQAEVTRGHGRHQTAPRLRHEVRVTINNVTSDNNIMQGADMG